MVDAAAKIATLLFGSACYLCRAGTAGARDPARLLCAACEQALPLLEQPVCPVCALGSPAGATCGRCLSAPPCFDATVCALEYVFPADVLVQALKFRGELALAGLFGRLLGARVGGGALLAAHRVMPVPLSGARLRERGFNQSMEIARRMAQAGRARLEPELCRRDRDTAAQAGLALKQRAANVRGAFGCTRSLDGETVAVVDDVMTTGATLNEVAKVLKAAGAARVVNWVVARTPAGR